MCDPPKTLRFHTCWLNQYVASPVVSITRNFITGLPKYHMWVTERQEWFGNKSQSSIVSTDKLVASGSSQAVSWQVIQSTNRDCQG